MPLGGMISPISSGLLHGGGGDAEGQEGASRHVRHQRWSAASVGPGLAA